VSITSSYTFIQAQPLYGFETDRREVSLGASTKLGQYWSVFGSGTYDLENNYLARKGIGFSYADECFTYLMTFSETRSSETEEPTQSVGFNISFRTLGDFGSATSNFTQ
jgi:LPS-assembly protein